MFKEKLSQTINEISNEISALSDEEFWKKFNTYKDGDIAKLLIEANAFYSDDQEPIAEYGLPFTISPSSELYELYEWISTYPSTVSYCQRVSSNNEDNNIVIPCEEECLRAA